MILAASLCLKCLCVGSMIVIISTGGLMWMDSAKSASLSSSVVFPGASDSIVPSEPSLSLSPSLLSVEGAGVYGAWGSCPSICPWFLAVCHSDNLVWQVVWHSTTVLMHSKWSHTNTYRWGWTQQCSIVMVLLGYWQNTQYFLKWFSTWPPWGISGVH